MNVPINSASPNVIELGARDMSIKAAPPRPIVIPTHLPLVFLFTESGPTTKELVDGARLVGMYGSGSFDRPKPFFNHASRLAEILMGAGNALMVKRIIPSDNDTISNVTVYLDIIKDDVNVYKRHDDGSIARDENGDPIVDKTVKGLRIKVIAEYNNDDEGDDVGAKTSKEGHMTNKKGDKSTMYPVMEFRGGYKGAKYNNVGFALNLPTHDNVNEDYLKANKALPFEFYVYERANNKVTGKIVPNMFGTETQQFVFDKNGRDPILDAPIDIKNTHKLWYNVSSPTMSLVYPKIRDPYVYYDNFNYVLNKAMESEKDYVNADVETVEGNTVNTSEWMDYLEDVDGTDQIGVSNVFTALSTKRVPNFTYYIDDKPVDLKANEKEVYFSKATPVYLDKGKDGTLSAAEFEAGVKAEMAKYVDSNSEVIDTAINIENVLYDSGFTLDTKKELVNFIALRKDTFVGLATREDKDGDKYKDLVAERAVALNLKARLSLAPESTFFGTPVARGIVVAGSGIDEQDPSRRRYTVLMSIVSKAARMMGGTKWKKALIFDRADKNIIKNYSDVQPAFIPKGVKPALWQAGLIWPQPLDRNVYCFPEMQSVYDNDGSAMNNIFMAIALTTTTKIADAAGRKFSGNISLKPSNFISAVESYMNSELNGKFGGVITASANVFITDQDAQRGYSWSAKTKLGGEIMKTVMTHYTEVWRKEDM